MNKDSFRLVSVSFVVRSEQAEYMRNELGQLPYGIYHMGTSERPLTAKEWREVKTQTPPESLC